jgi:vacuolar-type H+-ATPase catalytic subunit A/Vma1
MSLRKLVLTRAEQQSENGRTVYPGRGRRDGEVIETIEDFAGMKRSRRGLLPDYTVINYNTSSIPLAAREASTFMRITLGSTTDRWGSMHSLQV